MVKTSDTILWETVFSFFRKSFFDNTKNGTLIFPVQKSVFVYPRKKTLCFTSKNAWLKPWVYSGQVVILNSPPSSLIRFFLVLPKTMKNDLGSKL